MSDSKQATDDPYDQRQYLGGAAGGVRYRAVDRATQRPVELWRPWTENREQTARWRRRVRLAQLVDSPYARRVLAADWDGATPQVTLEWFDGESWRLRIERHGTPDFFELAKWWRGPLHALTAAHRAGLAHGHLSLDSLRFDEGPAAAEPVGRLDFHFLPLDRDEAQASASDDVRRVGEIWLETLGGPTALSRAAPAEFSVLLERMCAADPLDRPAAPTVLAALDLWLAAGPRIDLAGTHVFESRIAAPGEAAGTSTADGLSIREVSRESVRGATVARSTDDTDPLRTRATIGRFRLLAKLGEGGMGAVWKAEDPLDGQLVAIKVLRGDLARDERLLKRFHREARLLAEVDNPYVARLREINADEDLHYLVLEYVPGRDLGSYLKERGPLAERDGAAIVADVARALADAHERGIVHRDLKPENILLRDEASATPEAPAVPPRASSPHDSRVPVAPRVKLTDFGLARHVDETQTQNLTTAGALLGTPLYIAPEQCAGRTDVDARADVYSLGATLFHLLAGRPPFEAANLVGLVTKHLHEPAPRLRSAVPDASEAIEAVVAKCLEKRPADRYAGARELLDDLERLVRGVPTGIVAHPRIPQADAQDVLAFDFAWELKSSPERLWPHVSNTERLNRAIGLSAVEYETEDSPTGGVRRSGQFRKLGMTIAWEEHPYEWVEGRRMGVLREFSQGPWKWFTSVVEMTARGDGGTSLTHRIRILPSTFVGRTVAKIELGVRARKSLDRVYRHIDAAVSGELGPVADPFEDPHVMSAAQARALEERIERLVARGVEPTVADRLGEFLAEAPEQEVARIRPFALAARVGVDERAMLDACLLGAREGLLTLLWDILCPVCRVAAQVQETLKAIREHGSCAACRTDFPLDFANSIELVFRVAADLRSADTNTYCIGGPSHSPHVAAQVRLAPGEQFELALALRDGEYRLRGPQLPYSVDFRVAERGAATAWRLALSRGPDADLPRCLRAGSQRFVLMNDAEHEIVIRVERTASRGDACTAARAAATPRFRELFPDELLAPERLVQIEQITLLVTRLDSAERLYEQLGDAAAFARLHEHFRALDALVRREGGSLVKTLGEGACAVFAEPLAALRAALAIGQWNEPDLRVAVHRGPAMVATLNEHLDYFGSTVNRAHRLAAAPPRGLPAFAATTASAAVGRPQLVVTEAVLRDTRVASYLARSEREVDEAAPSATERPSTGERFVVEP